MFIFREIKEFKPNETRKNVNEEKKGYMKIKPETNMTFEEAKAYVESLFVMEE